MARNTYSNYIQLIFRFIAFMMMILSCRLATRTLQSINFRQVACPNCMIDGILGLNFQPVFFAVSFMAFFEFLGSIMPLLGFLLCLPAFFGLVIFLRDNTFAGLAPKVKPIFFRLVFIELGNWFDLLAFGTSFGYDLFEHDQFLSNWLCLEPIAVHTAVGLSYYKTNPIINQETNKNINGGSVYYE